MEIVQFPILSDNYCFLVRSSEGEVAVVDPAAAEPIRRELHKRDWKLDYIWNTHHHRDHVGANLELKKEFGARIIGSKKDRARIPGIDIEMSQGDSFFFGEEEVKVLSADGHTIGHIVFWVPSSKALFCGDLLFSLGSGKLFEGSAAQMWESLSKVLAMPEETMIYCAHEYTQENALFAVRAEPSNLDLKARIAEVNLLRAEGKATVPMPLWLEKKTNPFLRVRSAEIQSVLGCAGKSDSEILGIIREAKDQFDQSSV